MNISLLRLLHFPRDKLYKLNGQRLAENLHVIDFEQLKIENQQLNVGIPVIPSVSSYILRSEQFCVLAWH